MLKTNGWTDMKTVYPPQIQFAEGNNLYESMQLDTFPVSTGQIRCLNIYCKHSILTSISFSKKLAIFQLITKVSCYLLTESTDAIRKLPQRKVMHLLNDTLISTLSPG